MKTIKNAIESKLIAAQIRANQALNNDDGMETVQFLGILLLSITVAALLVSTMENSLDATFTAAATRLEDLFDFSAPTP